MSVSKEPLSIRNNNPGNLRFANQPGATPGEGGFARFETPEAGLSAMQRQIELDTQERGLTLSAFLNKYAPPSENKTSNYIDFVVKKTGLDPSSVVPAERIGDLQRAMIEMEGGPRSLGHFMQVSTAQAPTRAPGPRPTVQVASSTQLPASYQFALAANYLGDTEKESVTDQAMKLLEEIQSEEGGSGASSTKTKIGSILAPSEKTVDPFAIMAKAQEEDQPKRKAVPRMPMRFAEGGEAQKFSDEQVSQYLKERPELTDRQIAEAMNKYNVSQEQVSRTTGVTMPEVQHRYREATALTARPTLEGVGALWNKLHEQQFGTPVNLATAGQQNFQAQVTELQKEAERQQAEWDAKYGAGMPKAGTPMPTWGDTYNAWAPLYEQRFGTMINRPWNADIDAQNQKLALDQQYIQAVRDYNTKYGTNYAPEESVLGVNAQPNAFLKFPEKSRSGTNALLGLAGSAAGMYFFPGMDLGNMINRAMITAGTEGAKRIFNDGGEVVYRKDGSPEEGEMAAQQMTVGTLPPDQKPAGQVFRDIGRDVVRGAQYLPYDLLGAPVDIATMAMRPFGYNVEKPVGGSEYLIEKAAQAGIADRPTGSLAETASRIGMGFVNPAAGARQVGRGIEALRKGAETLELPGVAKTAPVGALMPKPRVDTSLLLPQENKPFIGEVERIVADLPGPVTKEQFLGMMRKQGRNYEIGRVEQALENLPEGSKIDPVDLFQRLQTTSPNRFTTEIVPPGSRYLYDKMDNPFPSIKPGAVNLLLDLPEDQKIASDLAEQARMVVTDLSPYKFLNQLADARSATALEIEEQGNTIASKVSNMTPVIRQIAELTGKNADDIIEPLANIAQQSSALMEIAKARAQLAYPAFTKTWRTYSNAPKDQLPADLQDGFGGLSVNKLLARISDEGLTDYERAIKNAPEGFKPVDKDQIANLRQYNEILRERGSIYDSGYKEQANLVERMMSEELGTSFSRLRDLTDRITTRVQKMADEIPTGYYEGTHRAIVSKNPISFSRFVEFTPNQIDELGISMPDQERGAVMFLELQSDRQKALRLSKEVEEAFPNMGKLPQVTQQLMIKNAIYGGIKMNKGLVLFPGSDSAQAQLYEKLGPNLKQVVKDLGPGFKASEFKFPNEKGEMATRWGVYIDEDAAKRVMTQGMRFAKGGMVDKPLYDRAA